MTAFVLGATGFVGREVVRQLVRARHEDRTRTCGPTRSQLAEWRTRFGELGAEVDTTRVGCGRARRRWRELKPAQVYILIGTTRSKAKSDAVAGQHLRGRSTRADADRRRRRARLARSRRASSTCRRSAPTPPRARRTCRARGQAEDVVTQSGLPWVIARPSIITGEREDSRLGERSAAVVGDGLLAVAGVFGAGSCATRYRSTTPDVLASALIRIGEAPEHDKIIDGAALR